MKRLKIIAIGTVAAVALAACGADKPDASSSDGALNGAGKTLNVLVQANTIYPQQQKQFFTDTSNAFKAQTGAEVKFDTFASANDELTKIQTSVLSGQGPDVYSLGTTFTPTAYATGAFLELTDSDWQKAGGKENFVPASLGISGPDAQHQVGIPFTSRPFVMAYNTDLLKA